MLQNALTEFQTQNFYYFKESEHHFKQFYFMTKNRKVFL